MTGVSPRPEGLVVLNPAARGGRGRALWARVVGEVERHDLRREPEDGESEDRWRFADEHREERRQGVVHARADIEVERHGARRVAALGLASCEWRRSQAGSVLGGGSARDEWSEVAAALLHAMRRPARGYAPGELREGQKVRYEAPGPARRGAPHVDRAESAGTSGAGVARVQQRPKPRLGERPRHLLAKGLQPLADVAQALPRRHNPLLGRELLEERTHEGDRRLMVERASGAAPLEEVVHLGPRPRVVREHARPTGTWDQVAEQRQGRFSSPARDAGARLRCCGRDEEAHQRPIHRTRPRDAARTLRQALMSPGWGSVGQFLKLFDNLPPEWGDRPQIQKDVIGQRLGTQSRVIRVETVGGSYGTYRGLTSIIDTGTGEYVYWHED